MDCPEEVNVNRVRIRQEKNFINGFKSESKLVTKFIPDTFQSFILINLSRKLYDFFGSCRVKISKFAHLKK